MTQEQKTAQLSPIPTGGRKSKKASKERKRDLKKAMKAAQGMKKTISAMQVYNKTWSEDEHSKFLEALKIYGKNYEMITAHV